MNPEEEVQAQEKNETVISVDDFLKENVKQTEDEKIKFDRFKSPFLIRALTAKDLTNIRRRATRKSFNKKLGQYTNDVDQSQVSDLMISTAIVAPDLSSSKLQNAYGTFGDEVATIQAMLTAGEYSELAEKIQEISGFDSTISEDIEQAKK